MSEMVTSREVTNVDLHYLCHATCCTGNSILRKECSSARGDSDNCSSRNNKGFGEILM